MKEKRAILSYLILTYIFILSNFSLAYKPVTKLYRPILNIPQIVTPGMEFRILFKPTVTPRNFWGRITSSIGISIPLIIVDWFEEGEYWLIRAVVPYGTPYDIYRLFVASDAESDSSLNAIRVIPQYLDNFYFVHITDTHLPNQLDPEHPYRYLDSNTLEEFNEILYEIQFINPEFVIHTGDLIDNYTIESQYQIAQDILSTSKVPIFVTAGNHDLNDFMIPYVQPGRVKWERYFGRIMNYTFVYGRIFFIGLEAYDTPSISFTDDQLNYLRTELTSSFERGDPCRVVFYHGDMRRLDLGLPQITDAFVDSYHIDMTLYGHTHIDSVYFLGSRGIPDINTSSTTCGNGRFRLIRINNGRVISYNALSWNHLMVSFSPANNGGSRRVVATINNQHSERFENGLLRFFLHPSSVNLRVNNGRIFQTLNLDTIIVVDVNVDIAPNSITSVEISGEPLFISNNTDEQGYFIKTDKGVNPQYVFYSLPAGIEGELGLINILGQKIFERPVSAQGKLDLQEPGLCSGIYFVNIQLPNHSESIKFTVLR